MFKLWPYQSEAVNKVRRSYQTGHRAPLVVIPTGGGKTIIFTWIAKQTAERGKVVWIIVHRTELLRQTASKLRKFGVRVGLISPKYRPDKSAPVQVGMVQTMVKRHVGFRPPDLIITDEAHHVVANNYREIVDYYDCYQLGVTATPCRSDGRGLGVEVGGVYDDLIIGPTTKELIDGGYLVKPRVLCPEQKIDFSRVGNVAGDFNKRQSSDIMSDKAIVGNVIDHYRSYSHQMPGVAFCVDVKHAIRMADEFKAAGYRAEAVYGNMDDNDRDRFLAGLGDGSVNVVTSCDVISEGTDIPAISTAMLLRPTQSEGLYLQQVGRALRTMDGKSYAWVLDHVGNVFRHGLPDQDREWSLNGEKKKARRKGEDDLENVNIYQCKECFAAFEVKLSACPECGAPKEVKQKQDIAEVDGDLTEITPEMALKIRWQKRKEQANAQTLEELEEIARQRGYKKNWAKHIYNARLSKRQIQ